MGKKQFIIKHPSQLNSLSTLPLFHRTGLGKIVFNESLQHPNKAQWEREINKNYYACGCSQGAKALIIGLLVFGIAGGIGYNNLDWSITNTLVTIFGGALAMAIVGKFIGLMNANGKLKETVREIQSVWEPHWPEAKIIGCG